MKGASKRPDPLATPERIAFAGDWHMNDRWAAAAIEYAADLGADVIVHLGDFGYSFAALFVQRTQRALAAATLPLLFIDGNHEEFPILLRYPVRGTGLREISTHIWHLPRGFRWRWGNTHLLALGGAYSVDRPWRVPGKSWWREEEITDAEIETVVAGGPADVLIAHDCPAGVDIPGLDDTAHLWPPLEIIRANEHRRRLRTVVDAVRPRALWHGHYHRRYSTVAELGYGPVRVEGLDCDATALDRNVVLRALDELVPAPATVGPGDDETSGRT